jgi:hypothetical protein
MKNLDRIGAELFNKIRGRFPNVTIGDEEGNVTNIPEEARYYDFSYTSNGVSLGKISVSLDNESGVSVIVSRDLVAGQDEDVQDVWYDFLRELRMFSKKRLMSFDVRDINKKQLNKKDYYFLAKNRSGDDQMSESKMYGTTNTSYQKIGNARLAIKHSQPINVESVNSRTQKIKAIYVESPEGERFKYPFKHLSGARAMAMHVSEGGNAYDDFGKYISGLSEEASKLRKFNQYIGRSSVMAETLGGYKDIVKSRVNEVKKEIMGLQKASYYKEAIAKFTPPLIEDVPDDVSENWIDQLTIKQFNEELTDIFPYIYRLVGEASKAKEVSYDDLVAEAKPDFLDVDKDGDKKEPFKKAVKDKKNKEDVAIESAFDKLMGQWSESPDSNDEVPTDDSNISDEEPAKTPLGEFILSYFDRETRKFPKGETAVLTAVQKEYGEQHVVPSALYIKRIANTNTDHSQLNGTQTQPQPQPQGTLADDTARLRRLSGM